MNYISSLVCSVVVNVEGSLVASTDLKRLAGSPRTAANAMEAYGLSKHTWTNPGMFGDPWKSPMFSIGHLSDNVIINRVKRESE